jgi:hypothetical protein
MANLLTQFASLLEDFARLRLRHRYPARRVANEYRKFRGYRRVESGLVECRRLNSNGQRPGSALRFTRSFP